VKDEPLVTNAADHRQLKKAGRSVKRQENQLKDDWKATFSTAESRRVLDDLLTFCKVHNTVFDENPYRTALNSGKQDVGHFVEARIAKADPQILFTMMREKAQET
jgi:methionyl-tRNA synthetase